MNVIIFHQFRAINVGQALSPAPLVPLSLGEGTPTPPGGGSVIQMTTLQAIGDAPQMS